LKGIQKGDRSIESKVIEVHGLVRELGRAGLYLLGAGKSEVRDAR